MLHPTLGGQWRSAIRGLGTGSSALLFSHLVRVRSAEAVDTGSISHQSGEGAAPASQEGTNAEPIPSAEPIPNSE